MSLSDLFNVSRATRRDKAREQGLLPTPTSARGISVRLCNICYTAAASYTCPKCNVPFCSLACFRSSDHEHCSAAFSSVAVQDASAASASEVNDADRHKVFDMLDRLQKHEATAKTNLEDASDSDGGDEDAEEGALRLAEIDPAQIEAASTDELLAMLTDKQRTKFLQAVKGPQSAAQLMHRLDQKAARRTLPDASAAQSGSLIMPHSQPEREESIPQNRPAWQSTPWYSKKSEALIDFSGRSSKQMSAFVDAIVKLSAARATGSAATLARPVLDLRYNLCAVLMAYAYILRNLDIASLSELTRPPSSARVAASDIANDSAASRTPQRKMQTLFENTFGESDDEGPPPLEPDLPDPVEPFLPLPAMSKVDASDQNRKPLGVEDGTMVEEAMDRLERLVPFLFAIPSRSATRADSLPSSRNEGATVLSTLEDASTWILSHLDLETEVGHGGADALTLQLIKDLADLLATEKLVPNFADDAEVEPRYVLVSRFALLQPEHAFAVAQSPQLLSAIADLFFFFDDAASIVSTADDRDQSRSSKHKAIRLAQRKLCFYLSNALFDAHTSSNISQRELPQQLRYELEKARSRIHATSEADKLAAALTLLGDNGAETSAIQVTAPTGS